MFKKIAIFKREYSQFTKITNINLKQVLEKVNCSLGVNIDSNFLDIATINRLEKCSNSF